MRSGETSDRTPQLAIAPGLHIRQYELISELGRGGMGVVWLASDTKLGRRVAMKFLLNASRDVAQRFLVEARATAQCSHDNIVVIHEVDEFDGTPYMVLELLEGQSLRDMMGAFGAGVRLPPSRVIELAIPIARALARAHELGIVHRDLKPENVFVTSAGQVKVLDFGIARALGGGDEARRAGEDTANLQLTREGAMIGTLPYMSPEQLGVDTVDHRADLWAIGIMLFEMLAGRHPVAPFSAEELIVNARSDRPLPSIGDVSDLPDGLAAIVDGCLRKRKTERTARAADLVTSLVELQLALQSPRLASLDERAPGARRKRARRWVALGGAASVLGVAVAMGWRSDRAEPVEESPLELAPAVGCAYAGLVTIDVVKDRETFVRSLGEIRTVDFDDVDTRRGMVNIAPERYASRGIVITSTDGQYVDHDFEFPADFTAVSPPNVFAAGPPAPMHSKVPAGGHDTELTFRAAGRSGCTSGIGMVFIDADFDFAGPRTGLVVRDRRDHPFASAFPDIIEGVNNTKQFRGIVTRDLTGHPVPAIAAVHVVTGNSWIQVDAGEGVALDDLVFGIPAPADE